jgi:hypothetical protein
MSTVLEQAFSHAPMTVIPSPRCACLAVRSLGALAITAAVADLLIDGEARPRIAAPITSPWRADGVRSTT